MWFTWGALSLLAFDLALQATGTVDFTAFVWMTLAVTLVLSVAVDRLRRRKRVVIDDPEVAQHVALTAARPAA